MCRVETTTWTQREDEQDTKTHADSTVWTRFVSLAVASSRATSETRLSRGWIGDECVQVKRETPTS